MIVDPQEFLAQRVADIKGLVTGEASIQRAASWLGPGSTPGKAAALQMFRSTGKPGAARMSLLGGDAPVRETGIEEVLDTPVNQILPGVANVVQSIR